MHRKINKHKFSYDVENLRIWITLQGGFFYREKVNAPAHSHNGYEFHLMFEGSSTLFSDMKGVTIEKHQGCIVPPNLIHFGVGGEDKAFKTTFCFSFEKIKRASEIDLYDKISKAFANLDDIIKIENASEYINDMNQILSNFFSDKGLAKIRFKMLFSLLVLKLAEDLKPQTAESSERFDNISVNEKSMRGILIEDYINSNLSKSVTIKGLAEFLYLSEKQTERIFKKEMGVDFKKYLAKLRIESAKYYLVYTDMSVKDIAANVGYTSYNGFYKLFLSSTGLTPSEYREKGVQNKNL